MWKKRSTGNGSLLTSRLIVWSRVNKRQARGSRCASKMNIKCTLQGTKVCYFVATVAAACADSCHRSVLSDVMMITFHAVGMGLRHYPGYWEIRTCEEHTRTTDCIPTAHGQQSILPLVFKQHLHSCHVLRVTDTQSAAADQHSELYNILWTKFVAHFPTNGEEEMLSFRACARVLT
jgi:hypothetical protein